MTFRLRAEVSTDEISGDVCGQVASGKLTIGDKIKVLPQAKTATISAIKNQDGSPLNEAHTGQIISLELTPQLAIHNGNILTDAQNPVETSDQFEVIVTWHDERPLLSGRPYRFQFGSMFVHGSITTIKYALAGKDNTHQAAVTLTKGQTGVVTISLKQSIAFTSFEQNQTLGSFSVFHRKDDAKLADGKIKFALRRASNIHRQAINIDRSERAKQKNQRPCVLWFTGLSGSGKSTIANALETQLLEMGKHTCLLDGDNVRHGLNRDLGFTDTDRVENIRRISEVAKLMTDAGLIVITSFISPFRAERQMARDKITDGEFFEIFIDAPLEVCEQRDEKGLYAKARAGLVKNFTGIDSAYEAPTSPDITIASSCISPDQAAKLIIDFLEKNAIIK